MQARELRTEPLSAAQLRGSISPIARLLDSWGQGTLVAMFGAVGNNLPIDELWKPVEIAPTQVEAFIIQSEAQGIFRLGASDLIIENWQRDIKFTLCHESDIHFVSDNESRLAQVLKLWQSEGFTVYVSNYTPVGRPDWKQIDPLSTS